MKNLAPWNYQWLYAKGDGAIALMLHESIGKHLRVYVIANYSALWKAQIRGLLLKYAHKIEVSILIKRTPAAEIFRQFSEARILPRPLWDIYAIFRYLREVHSENMVCY